MGLFDKVGSFLKREAEDLGEAAESLRDKVDDELTKRERELEMTPSEKIAALQQQASATDEKFDAIANKAKGRADMAAAIEEVGEVEPPEDLPSVTHIVLSDGRVKSGTDVPVPIADEDGKLHSVGAGQPPEAATDAPVASEPLSDLPPPPAAAPAPPVAPVVETPPVGSEPLSDLPPPPAAAPVVDTPPAAPVVETPPAAAPAAPVVPEPPAAAPAPPAPPAAPVVETPPPATPAAPVVETPPAAAPAAPVVETPPAAAPVVPEPVAAAPAPPAPAAPVVETPPPAAPAAPVVETPPPAAPAPAAEAPAATAASSDSLPEVAPIPAMPVPAEDAVPPTMDPSSPDFGKTPAQLKYERARAAANNLLDELRGELKDEGEI